MCARTIVEGVEVLAQDTWWALDLIVPLRARRYYVAAATAGTFGDGLIDDFARGVFGPSVGSQVADLGPDARVRGAKALAAARRPADGPLPLQVGRSAYGQPSSRYADGRAVAAHRADQGTRDEAAAAFLSSLDALHAESFQPEQLDRGD